MYWNLKGSESSSRAERNSVLYLFGSHDCWPDSNKPLKIIFDAFQLPLMNIRHPSTIKSGATNNIFQSALRRTRIVINYIVKPRPV